MAIHADCVFEIRTDGDDNNGGGFKSSASGTDRSQQAAAHATLTTASTVNATTTIIDVASGDYTCTDADVGNIIQITGGTATAGFYEITARSAQQWTLDRSAGTSGQTVVAKMGGALATPGTITNIPYVTGNKFWIKSGTYTMTTGTAGPGGPLHADSLNEGIIVEGYGTTRGDLGTKPVIDVGAQNNMSMVKVKGYYSGTAKHISVCRNIKCDGQDTANVYGFGRSTGFVGEGLYEDCEAVNCDRGFNDVLCVRCKAVSCTTGFNATGPYACLAESCTTGFTQHNSKGAVRCIARLCGKGFSIGPYGGQATIQCVADNNTGFGFDPAWAMETYFDCVATNNGDNGWDSQGAGSLIYNCAGYNNTNGDFNETQTTGFNFISLTADPWEDSANGDYRLNNASGGGAALRAAGVDVLGSISDGTSVSAIQHNIAGGSTGFYWHTEMWIDDSQADFGDETSITNMTPSINNVGATWENHAGTGWLIDGMRLWCTGTNEGSYKTLSGTHNIAGFDLTKSDFKCLYLSHEGYANGIIFRHDKAGDGSFYMVYQGGEQLQLYEYDGVSAGFTTLWTASPNPFTSTREYCRVEFQCVGTELKIWADDSLLTTQTISNNTTDTWVGVYTGAVAYIGTISFFVPNVAYSTLYPPLTVGRQAAIPHPLYGS